MATEHAFRAIYTTADGQHWLALDFFADNAYYAEAHAAQARTDPEWGTLVLTKVVRLRPVEMVDPGAWRPIDPPRQPVWARANGRRR